MKERAKRGIDEPSGDRLLAILGALASPQRIRIVGALSEGRQYVSELARQIGISRPLLIMHLQRLEAAGLVKSTLELSDDGKAMKYFEVAPFALHLTPAPMAEAARALADEAAEPGEPQAVEGEENDQ